MQQILSFVFLLVVSKFALADVNNDLKSYFNKLGYSANVTSPHAYQGQNAGYYTGGSLYVRNQVRDITIAHMETPSYRSGCGGIDIYTGGLSVINSKQFINAINNVINNAGAYAVTLALEEASPIIANGLKYWNQISNFVNNSNLNSCETAEALVGGLWPKTEAAQRRVCEDVGSGTGYFKDWAEARQGCGKDDKTKDVWSRGKSRPDYKDQILDNGNLAWQALQKNDFLKNDIELAEMFMSLSGTIIIRDNGKNIDIKDSNSTDKGLLKAILYGDSADVYACLDSTEPDGCLVIGKRKINISKDHSFHSAVQSLLDDMVVRIREDRELSNAEKGLLESTSLPIYKMLNVQVAYNKGSTVFNVSDYADIIATDILFQYLEENLEVVKRSSYLLPYPPDQLETFQKGIQTALENVREERKSAYASIQRTTLIIQETQFLEKTLAGSLSTELASSISWANHLKSSR